MAGDEIKNKNNFLLSLNGQIHSAFFPFFDDIYCKYSFVCGPDWVIISGVEEGISQISKKGRDEEQLFIWNLPLNIAFKSTNPFGWPQMVISAYGSDAFDNEVVRGYGVCHIPITPGPCEKEIPMFVPESSSVIQKFTSWLTGRRPEFIDPRILTQGDAREEMAPVAQPNVTKKEPYPSREKFQHFWTPRNLRKESERLKTFANWTVSFLDSEKLAKNGFYYTNTADVVKCAFCDVQIGCWKQGDVPEQDHRRLSPNCPFLIRQDCGNQAPSENGEGTDESKEDEVKSQDVCGSYGLEIRPFSAPERPGKMPFTIESSDLWRDFEELGVSKIQGPVSPYYATYNSRIKTFEKWPIPEIQSPEKLAEAGFYYTSFQDNVLCFHCGGGLKNWQVEDNPWVEHACWFSKCGFILLRKGKEFVNEVLAKEKRRLAARSGKGLASNCESNSTTTQSENQTNEQSASTPNSLDPSISYISSSDRENQQSLNSDAKEIELCRICYVRERGIVFLPCGHFVSCTQCAPALRTCAVCRKPFEATVRAYLS